MGSLLRAALGPKTRAPWPAWGYYDDQAMALLDLLDHPMKESHRRVSRGSETRPVYVQSIIISCSYPRFAALSGLAPFWICVLIFLTVDLMAC